MQSIWRAAAAPPTYPSLTQNLDVDVAIIGGGITGLLCAARLCGGAKRVAVLEALRIGQGSTGNSTGNLYALVGERHHTLDRRSAADVLRARATAVDDIEAIVESRRIDCGFVRCPWVTYAESDAGRKEIDRARELAETIGLGSWDAAALLPFPVKAAIGVDRQAQFNPLRFVVDLAQSLRGESCEIFEHTRVISIESGEPCVVHTEQAQVRASFVVLATHTPKGVLKIHAAIAPYREYGIAAPFTSASLKPGIFWSAEEPFHSVRSYRFRDQDHLVVVGGEHKTGEDVDTVARYEKLAAYARTHFNVSPVEYRWSAQNYRPADGLPYIGKSALGDNVFEATGYAADGLTYAAVAARVIEEMIAGRESRAQELFATGRFTPIASAKNIVTEGVKVAKEYARALPGAKEIDSLAKLAAGEGHIVELNGEKCAAYREEGGALTVVSAVCTHLKCIVRWNAAEKTWDCPCHGSRFTLEGTVLEGPALADLPSRTPAEAPDAARKG